MTNRKLKTLRLFENLVPEGIAFNSDVNEFLITFDNGGEHPSQALKLRNME
jgi:hypothetical protein